LNTIGHKKHTNFSYLYGYKIVDKSNYSTLNFRTFKEQKLQSIFFLVASTLSQYIAMQISLPIKDRDTLFSVNLLEAFV
jgi:hypothetical protein